MLRSLCCVLNNAVRVPGLIDSVCDTAPMPERIVSLGQILAARERLSKGIHRMLMQSPATAVCAVTSRGNVELPRLGAFCAQAAPLPA
jgi:hypothetical protein